MQPRGKETDKYGFLFLLPFGGLYVPFGRGTFFACRQRVSAAQNITVPPRCLSKTHVGAHARKAVKHTRKGSANEDVHPAGRQTYTPRVLMHETVERRSVKRDACLRREQYAVRGQ